MRFSATTSPLPTVECNLREEGVLPAAVPNLGARRQKHLWPRPWRGALGAAGLLSGLLSGCDAREERRGPERGPPVAPDALHDARLDAARPETGPPPPPARDAAAGPLPDADVVPLRDSEPRVADVPGAVDLSRSADLPSITTEDGARDAVAVRVDARGPDAAPADAAPPEPDTRPPPPDGPAPPLVHPPGYADPAVHGPSLKLGGDDCRICHGEDLAGAGRAPSCDGCHRPFWRMTCTFCHGGTDSQTGAPPRDLDGESDPATLSFSAHTAHTTAGDHPAYACRECHRTPVDVTSAGHVFDDTPGVAEVDFSGGIRLGGVYLGSGRCDSLYCHGTGAITGRASVGDLPPTCDTCHPMAGLLSFHARHLAQGGIVCADCHAATVAPPAIIVTPALHVNGHIDVELALPAMEMTGGACSGTCHGEIHVRRVW